MRRQLWRVRRPRIVRPPRRPARAAASPPPLPPARHRPRRRQQWQPSRVPTLPYFAPMSSHMSNRNRLCFVLAVSMCPSSHTGADPGMWRRRARAGSAKPSTTSCGCGVFARAHVYRGCAHAGGAAHGRAQVVAKRLRGGCAQHARCRCTAAGRARAPPLAAAGLRRPAPTAITAASSMPASSCGREAMARPAASILTNGPATAGAGGAGCKGSRTNRI